MIRVPLLDESLEWGACTPASPEAWLMTAAQRTLQQQARHVRLAQPPV
ncbi:MAG: hypothetical protein WCJ87_04555 [Burkholderiales bacterium]